MFSRISKDRCLMLSTPDSFKNASASAVVFLFLLPYIYNALSISDAKDNSIGVLP